MKSGHFLFALLSLNITTTNAEEPLGSKGPMAPVLVQPYAGISRVFGPDEGSTNSLQTGIIYNPFKNWLYISIENNYSNSLRSYEWPQLGNYQFKRTYNNTGFGIGGRLNRTHRFSIACGIRVYYYYKKEEIVTDNDQIKEYVVNGYSYYHDDICLSVHFDYRIHRRIALYANFNRLRAPLNYKTSRLSGGQNIIGLGLTYNFYGK